MVNSALSIVVTFQSAGTRKEKEECTTLKRAVQEATHDLDSGVRFKTVLNSNPPCFRENTAVVALSNYISMRRLQV